jgi:hypothetical protein
LMLGSTSEGAIQSARELLQIAQEKTTGKYD